MIHTAIVIGITLVVCTLIYKRLIQIDISFPWLVSLIFLSALSINPEFVIKLSDILDIDYEPLAVIFVTIFILFGLVTTLLVAYTNLRKKQMKLERKIALIDLKSQEIKTNKKK